MASYCFEARDSDSQTMLEFRSRIQQVLGTEERLMQSERPLSLAVLVARITRSGARAIVDFRISRGLWIFTIADTVVSFFLEV